MADDATPPLVAASPVPPVVPDSEALSSLPTSMLRPDDGAWYDKDDPDDNPPQVVPELLALAQRIRGSGVVPDKPALAPETSCICYARAPGRWTINAPVVRKSCPVHGWGVPAVTDDEAATDWPLIAAFLTATHGIPEDSQDDDDRGWAIEAIALLRSAGFLIVHHTKET